MKNIKVIIATHKKYQMPSDSIYLPVQVGAEGKNDLGYQKDNENDNISLKNPNFCELTGLYWAWKNLKVDYIGLAHYRRHFSLKKKNKNVFKNVLTLEEADKILDNVDIITPKKRRYYIENLYNHYKHSLYIEPLDITGNIIKEKYPEYYGQFLRLKKRRSAHMFNMFIMKKDKLDEYCTWLFDILFTLESKINLKDYDSFHSRLYGRISELLFDVWLNVKGYSYKEVKVISIEKVNWFKKGTGFLKAKFFGKKYEKSI
ncbi:MAG: DUF4422 domain-containing protein [Bacilli bacterium]|nr:DUF4422 domain-containing protein [Bacilli bacterium]